jgi:mRNA interferase RelE/StbE
MLNLEITRQARDFFKNLPPKQYRQVFNKILALMENPEIHDSIKLHGYDYRRADIGEYRIIYKISGNTLQVFLIGKRNDDEIYDKLSRH